MSIINKDNEKYEFVESKTGFYYRFENFYKIITSKLKSKDENVRWTGKKYDKIYVKKSIFNTKEKRHI